MLTLQTKRGHAFDTASLEIALLCAGPRPIRLRHHPYQTQHTFASRLLAEGEQEALVAVLLGHSTVEMVRRHMAGTSGKQKESSCAETMNHLGQRKTALIQKQRE